MEFNKIIEGVVEFSETIINPSLIQFSQVYEYLNFFVFVAFIILGLGLTTIIAQKTNKMVALAITFMLALSAVVNKQFFPFLIIMIAVLGSGLKAIGGFILSKYLMENKAIFLVFIIILVVTYILMKTVLLNTSADILSLYKLAIIAFGAFGNFQKLNEVYFNTPFSHQQTILGLTILIALTSLIDFTSVNVAAGNSLLKSMFVVFMSYTFVISFLAGILHHFFFER